MATELTPSQLKMLKAALQYRKWGYSVIPIKPPIMIKGKDEGKKPWLEWKIYQSELPDEETIKAWFDKNPDSRIALVTGKINNIVIIDTDSVESLQIMEEDFFSDSMSTTVAKTPLRTLI